MKRKLTAMAFALFFPLLHLLARIAVPRLAYAAALRRIEGRSPGLDRILLENQARHAVRIAAPWLLIAAGALTLLAVFLILRRVGSPMKAPEKARRVKPGMALTLFEVALGLNVSLNAALALLPLPESWAAEHSERVSDPLAAAGFLPLFLCTVIAAPIVEEVIFRGLCFRFLQKTFSPSVAVLWQAVLFAAFHGSKLQMIYVFPAAVVLGLSYLRCGTLAAPLLLHMVFNAVSLFELPMPGAVWGQLLWFAAGGAIVAFGLRALFLKSIPRAAESMSPRPPQQ